MHQQPKHIDGECMLGEKKKHLQNNGHALIEDKYKKKTALRQHVPAHQTAAELYAQKA